MFRKIPTILRSQELLDKAFLKASKIEEPYYPNIVDKIRKEVIDRISTIEGVIVSHLNKIVKKFPTIEKVHPFYYDLVDLMFDIDKYKMSLGKIQWTSQKIEDLSTNLIQKLKRAKEVGAVNAIMRQYYGRVSSLVKEIEKDLLFLSQCKDYMRKIPDIEVEMRTYLIAGMPNVGKSSLLSAITTTKPKIASYPFTTQSISMGYVKIDDEKFQVIDTPGILDRPMSKRNEMEQKAIMALKDINGVIIFLFDGSGQSGYTYEQQENLFDEIERTMHRPMIRVQSKIDVTDKVKEDIAVSAETGEGLDQLKKIMFEKRTRLVR